MRSFVFAIMIISLSCSSGAKKETKPLSEKEAEILNTFADRLTSSILNLEYDLINSAWSHEAFKLRVGRLIKTNPTVFNVIYDEEIKVKVSMANVDLINKQKYEQAKLYPIRTDILEDHAEVTYLLLYGNSFRFIKYRVELINNKPTLTDTFLFTDNIWQSQYMANMVRLNKKYLAGSNERTQANMGILNYQGALRNGDTLAALKYLDDIPQTHQIGNWLSLLRISCAKSINDTLFYSVLEKEKNENSSLYLNYLYGYFVNDSLELDKTFRHLEQQVGINRELIDLIQDGNLFWN